MSKARLSAMVLAFVLPLTAMAQWQWIDNQGKKVYSDRPPPTDVPEKNILSQPRNAARAAPVAVASPADGDAQAPIAPVVKSAKTPGTDKELEDKVRKTEEAEKARRATQEQKVAQARAENCKLARQGKATLDSGIRIVRTNDKGEREFLDDAGRAAEEKRTQSIIDSDCK